MRLSHTAPLGDEESDRLRDPTDGLDVDALIVSVEGFGDGSVLASDRDLEPTWSIAPAQALLGLNRVFLHRDWTAPVLDGFDVPRHSLSRSVLCGWEPVMTDP